MLWPEDDFQQDEVLCINFVNTVSWRGKPKPNEHLTNIESWLDWAKEEGLASVEAIEELASRGVEESEAAFERAIQFREALYNFLKAFGSSEDPGAKDRLLVQEVLARAMGRLKLSESKGGWAFELNPGSADWEALLCPCALSAAQLVAGPWSSRLRVCSRDECLWLFMDNTKNRSRKWCDMTTCGNVVKARRSYARKKAKTA